MLWHKFEIDPDKYADLVQMLQTSDGFDGFSWPSETRLTTWYNADTVSFYVRLSYRQVKRLNRKLGAPKIEEAFGI